jgi:hypothetical protein
MNESYGLILLSERSADSISAVLRLRNINGSSLSERGTADHTLVMDYDSVFPVSLMKTHHYSQDILLRYSVVPKDLVE